MVDTDRRWQVFEVKLDGTGLKKLIETPEKDLEFFDATYLPSGKLIAVSNIGYNGVPCVNGNDEVGNMCLYDPKDGSLRRLTFDRPDTLFLSYRDAHESGRNGAEVFVW